jgi:hypothetical protein
VRWFGIAGWTVQEQLDRYGLAFVAACTLHTHFLHIQPTHAAAEPGVHVGPYGCRSLGVYALPPLTHNGEEVRALTNTLLLLVWQCVAAGCTINVSQPHTLKCLLMQSWAQQTGCPECQGADAEPSATNSRPS